MEKQEPKNLDRQELWRLVEENPALSHFSDETKRNAVATVANSVYMDIREDVAFRYCFSDDKESLICLLNDILNENITDLEYLPNQVIAANLSGKKPIMDVYCRTPSGEFICEMQNYSSTDFKDRLLYYGSTVIHNGLKSGKSYRFLPVHIVAFTNFETRHPQPVGNDRMTFTYLLREEGSVDDILTRSLSITLCELPRMKMKSLSEARTPVEEWFVLFNNIANFAKKPEGLPRRLEHVVQRAEFITTDRKMVAQYIEHLVTKEQIENYTQPAYERGFDDGIVQGIAQGIEQTKRETAAAFKEKGVELSVISACTGLSVEELEAL